MFKSPRKIGGMAVSRCPEIPLSPVWEHCSWSVFRGGTTLEIILAQSKFVKAVGVLLLKNLFSLPSLCLKILSVCGFPFLAVHQQQRQRRCRQVKPGCCCVPQRSALTTEDKPSSFSAARFLLQIGFLLSSELSSKPNLEWDSQIPLPSAELSHTGLSCGRKLPLWFAPWRPLGAAAGWLQGVRLPVRAGPGRPWNWCFPEFQFSHPYPPPQTLFPLLFSFQLIAIFGGAIHLSQNKILHCSLKAEDNLLILWLYFFSSTH